MGWWGYFIRKGGPPGLILIINLTVINILDIASVLEGYESHSRYQITVYIKTTVYSIFNMFIIPILTMSLVTGSGTLWEVFQSQNFNIAKILGELFLPKSGEFFILLLVQQGVCSAAFYALNCSDIFWSYMSPAFAFELRKIYNDQAPWRRNEQTTFLYGYFNS